MNKKKSALILIGYQNDYFAKDGILREVIEATNVIENTMNLINQLNNTLIISTPIVFTENYSELVEPIGILKTVKDVGAFKIGSHGSEAIDEIKEFGSRILESPGKQGLNAFINTDLELILKENLITEIIIAGAVCSICIDSTGRAAFDKGFNVTMLSDCISGRTVFEQELYCNSIFPLYADVTTSLNVIKEYNTI